MDVIGVLVAIAGLLSALAALLSALGLKKGVSDVRVQLNGRLEALVRAEHGRGFAEGLAAARSEQLQVPGDKPQLPAPVPADQPATTQGATLPARPAG